MANEKPTMPSAFSRSSRESAGPRDWILDIYGSLIREFGGWIAVADLIALLETVGVPPSSGRSALSRMKRRGELESVTKAGQRGYSLTESAEQWFEDGTARIMKGPPNVDEDQWLLASFTVPEQDRSIRYRIRARLQDLGFGQVSGGLMIAPANVLVEATNALARANFTDYVALWRSEHIGFGDLDELVRNAWDLPAIDEEYESYLTFAADLCARPAPESDSEAFVRYVSNVNAWRDLPFRDPSLPLKHLPPGWRSVEARAAFTALEADLRLAARRHFTQVTGS